MYLSVDLMLVLTTMCTVCLSMDTLKCTRPKVARCGPHYGCKKSCTNSRPNEKCKSLPCRVGCFCPQYKPIEMVKANFKLVCLPDLRQCKCSGGRVWRSCRAVPEPTCNNPQPANKVCEGPPGCYCPNNIPIWHKETCISSKNCGCLQKCTISGCNQCRKCQCRNGRAVDCEDSKKVCPIPTTKKGLKQLHRAGCSGQTLISKSCIFFSPCPKRYQERLSESCSDDLIQHEGCWTSMHGQCTYVAPCPEEGDLTCRELGPGINTCNMCRQCECMSGLKICHGPAICSDPDQNGCMVKRSYYGMAEACFWVSPCPEEAASDAKECKKTGEIINKEDFCYAPNEETAECEFLSPCPNAMVCKDGDIYCRECQECVCSHGVVECEAQECRDPIPLGCWVEGSEIGLTGCLFVSPCPVKNTETPHRSKCPVKTGQFFCNQCNTCTCLKDREAPKCSLKDCEVTVTKGCHVPYKGTCIFVLPCP